MTHAPRCLGFLCSCSKPGQVIRLCAGCESVRVKDHSKLCKECDVKAELNRQIDEEQNHEGVRS